MSSISGTAADGVFLGTLGIVHGIKTWSLDVANGELDASKFGSTWRLTDSGIKEWSGSFEGNYDDTDAQQTAMWSFQNTGEKVEMTFYVGQYDYLFGTIVLVAFSPIQFFDGLGAASWSFRGYGPLTRG